MLYSTTRKFNKKCAFVSDHNLIILSYIGNVPYSKEMAGTHPSPQLFMEYSITIHPDFPNHMLLSLIKLAMRVRPIGSLVCNQTQADIFLTDYAELNPKIIRPIVNMGIKGYSQLV